MAGLPIINLPIPFRFGLAFDWATFVPFAIIYVALTLEVIGDITATSMVSGEPISGDLFPQAQGRHLGRWGELAAGVDLQHLSGGDLGAEQRDYSAHRGGQSLCGLLCGGDSVGFGAVSDYRRDFADDSAAGGRRSSDADVWHGGSSGNEHPALDADGQSLDGDFGGVVGDGVGGDVFAG